MLTKCLTKQSTIKNVVETPSNIFLARQNILVKGAIIGKAEIYDVKKYISKSEIIKDSKKHLASKSFQNNKYGFLIKNAKPFRIPIPAKGKLGFFEVKLEQKKIKKSEIISDLIDEEYRYQWIGRH